MDKPVEHYWNKRLEDLREALEANRFEVFIAQDRAEARDIVLEDILPAAAPKSVSWGGSGTFTATGLYDALKDRGDLEVIDTYDKSLPLEEKFERRRQALLADLFITGTNAVTETGELVNLDMIGNRVAAIAYGPKNVVILVGRNKICADLFDAMNRVKNYAGPTNAMRLDMKTPCVKTGRCMDCNSPERICNVWTVTDKSFPEGRIKIVLINENLGL